MPKVFIERMERPLRAKTPKTSAESLKARNVSRKLAHTLSNIFGIGRKDYVRFMLEKDLFLSLSKKDLEIKSEKK